MNNRTHRKLLVVDGVIGFTGGVGIADRWRGRTEDEKHWRDSHFRAEGPVVAQIQAVFMDNWIKATGRVLHSDAYFPPLEQRGSQHAQMFSSSPTGGSESMRLMYLMTITAARSRIRKASHALWGPLLEAGIQISEYQPTMFHCKLMVVDALLVSVGSNALIAR